ncbi:MAG: PDZ domain-containing protein [Desulfotomaculum sp.]|nr:PDZ domain-containing protein [Desulfotomaculum sp.]
MFKRFSLVLVLLMTLFCVQPAAAYEDYIDGVTTIEEILDYTLHNHVDKPELDELVNGAIDGMLKTLDDPYTEYLTPEALEDFTDSLNGNYVGIGIRMEEQDGYPVILEVFVNSPAQAGGLKPGDIITAVEGEDIGEMPLALVAAKIQGPEGSKVTLTIKRQEKTFDVTLTRKAVTAPTVMQKVVFDDIGYINVDSFGRDTAVDFTAAIDKLKSQNVKGLIIDLRNNPGGYLTAAVRMTGHFLPLGTKVVSVVDRDGERQVYRSIGSADAAEIPVVVLVNANTASAAEILAGALQDHKAAVLVGDQTYGKGTVQTVFNLSNGGALKLTMARYQLPSGRFIDGIGLTPDRQVLSPGLQLHAARQILKPADQLKIIFTLAKNEAVLNGEKVDMMGTPYSKNGVYYLPLRFVMESLGYVVNFDSERNGVQMTKGDEGVFIPAGGSKTVHPIEIREGLSYISLEDINTLGINCRVENDIITVTKD